MLDWWNSLTILGQVFTCIAVPSTIILLIQVALSLLGLGDNSVDGGVDISDFDSDGLPDGIFGEGIDGDPGFDGDLDFGFRIFSFRSMIAFFSIFGWSGLVLLKNGLDSTYALIFALMSGFLAMIAVAFIFYWMNRLQQDGSRNIRNALGQSGVVYIRIPPSRTGKGKVNIMLQGTMDELDAVTDEETDITFMSEIVVIGISGQNTLIVKRK